MCYAEEFLQLFNIIFHSSTFITMIAVLPTFLFHKIRDSDEYIDKLHSKSELKRKQLIVKMKELMELELECSIEDVDHYEALNSIT